MSIQSLVNHAINVDRNRSITLKGESGPVRLPDDVTLNLIECSIESLSLGMRNTVNVTGGSITGDVSTAENGQCQLMLHEVNVSDNIVLNNCLCEIVKCNINCDEISLNNGSKCRMVHCDIKSRFNVTESSHIDLIGKTDSETGDKTTVILPSSNVHTEFNVNNSSMFVSDYEFIVVGPFPTSSAVVSIDNGSRLDTRNSDFKIIRIRIIRSSAALISSGSMLSSVIIAGEGSSMTISDVECNLSPVTTDAGCIHAAQGSSIDIYGGSLSTPSNASLLRVSGDSRIFVSGTSSITSLGHSVECVEGFVQIVGFESINSINSSAIKVGPDIGPLSRIESSFSSQVFLQGQLGGIYLLFESGDKLDKGLKVSLISGSSFDDGSSNIVNIESVEGWFLELASILNNFPLEPVELVYDTRTNIEGAGKRFRLIYDGNPSNVHKLKDLKNALDSIYPELFITVYVGGADGEEPLDFEFTNQTLFPFPVESVVEGSVDESAIEISNGEVVADTVGTLGNVTMTHGGSAKFLRCSSVGRLDIKSAIENRISVVVFDSVENQVPTSSFRDCTVVAINTTFAGFDENSNNSSADFVLRSDDSNKGKGISLTFNGTSQIGASIGGRELPVGINGNSWKLCLFEDTRNRLSISGNVVNLYYIESQNLRDLTDFISSHSGNPFTVEYIDTNESEANSLVISNEETSFGSTINFTGGSTFGFDRRFSNVVVKNETQTYHDWSDYRNYHPLPSPVKGETESASNSQAEFFPRVKSYNDLDGYDDYELVEGELLPPIPSRIESTINRQSGSPIAAPVYDLKTNSLEHKYIYSNRTPYKWKLVASLSGSPNVDIVPNSYRQVRTSDPSVGISFTIEIYLDPINGPGDNILLANFNEFDHDEIAVRLTFSGGIRYGFINRNANSNYDIPTKIYKLEIIKSDSWNSPIVESGDELDLIWFSAVADINKSGLIQILPSPNETENNTDVNKFPRIKSGDPAAGERLGATDVGYRDYKLVEGQLVPLPVKGDNEAESQDRQFPRVKSFADMDSVNDYELIEGQLVPVPATGDENSVVVVKSENLTGEQDLKLVPDIIPTEADKNKIVMVNASGTGFVFVDLAGQGGMALRVNTAGTGLEFFDASAASHDHDSEYSETGHSH